MGRQFAGFLADIHGKSSQKLEHRHPCTYIRRIYSIYHTHEAYSILFKTKSTRRHRNKTDNKRRREREKEGNSRQRQLRRCNLFARCQRMYEREEAAEEQQQLTQKQREEPKKNLL